ncbi:hypothetical protein H7I41_23360, partial [Mycobacterium manitobense]|nr:hypothetical protein [[Mycobacterium] manitobense]
MTSPFTELLASKIRTALEQDWQNVIAVSEFIHANVEESSKEFACSARLTTELEHHGFTVEHGVAGMDTAFRTVEHGVAGMDTAFRASFGSPSAA